MVRETQGKENTQTTGNGKVPSHTENSARYQFRQQPEILSNDYGLEALLLKPNWLCVSVTEKAHLIRADALKSGNHRAL